jgi:hypothetical protein
VPFGKTIHDAETFYAVVEGQVVINGVEIIEALFLTYSQFYIFNIEYYQDEKKTAVLKQMLKDTLSYFIIIFELDAHVSLYCSPECKLAHLKLEGRTLNRSQKIQEYC